MFERVSNKLVQSQKSNMREDEVAIYQYGYYLLFEVALNMSLGLICGILLHAVNMVFLFWIIYIPIVWKVFWLIEQKVCCWLIFQNHPFHTHLNNICVAIF